MHRTKRERLKDDVIGEAVFSLLKENAPVNFTSLADRLKRMAEKELEHERHRALADAFEEISARITGTHSRRSVISDHYGLTECYRNKEKKH